MYSIYSNIHYMLSSHKKLAVFTLNCRVLLTDVGSIVGDHVLVVVDASVGNVLRGHRRYPEQPLKTNHQTASLATLLSVSFMLKGTIRRASVILNHRPVKSRVNS